MEEKNGFLEHSVPHLDFSCYITHPECLLHRCSGLIGIRSRKEARSSPTDSSLVKDSHGNKAPT